MEISIIWMVPSPPVFVYLTNRFLHGSDQDVKFLWKVVIA